jgi:GNAT superfamily N-acetyltransferase
MEETVARESRPVRAQNGGSSVRVLGVWWKTVSVTVGLRVARPEDASTLREIERRAGEQFRRVNDIADHEPPSVATLVGYANARRCWVAFDADDKPIGYLLVDDVDGNAHIEQVSVEPEHQGMGVGRSLIDQARTWAKDTGRPTVTLTTFADVHAPLYAHLGFSVLQDDEIGSELRARRREEAERGLDDLMPRVCMKLPL